MNARTAKRSVRHVFILAPVVFAAGLASGCFGKDPYNPGTSLGTFRVMGTIVSNSCAEAPNPWEFDVKLSRDDKKLYWLSGGLPAEGVIDSSSHAVLSSEDTRTVREADPKTKTAACVLLRKDTLDTVLSNAPVSSFIGNLTYRFEVVDGSDCADQLVTAGGGFDALPCQVTYRIAGQIQGDGGTE